MNPRSRLALPGLPAAVALAGSAALVYWTSTSRPLWVDEEMLLLNIRDRGVLQLGGPLWLDQSAPLGWLVLERLALITLGPREPAVRLLTIVFGIAALATAVWIGRRWMSTAAAAVFVAVCAAAEWPVFFTLELKHYSADMFGALMVTALGGWTLDASRDDLRRRVLVWWTAAAALQWFSNGALFVTPLCAMLVVVAATARGGTRAAASAVAGAALWSLSFVLNYAVVLRHAAANEYLRTYWAFAFPPTSSGLGPTLAWIGRQAESFAVKPGSTELTTFFWIAWIAGIPFAAAARRSHALMVATIPAAILGLALFHVVPPFERLVIWAVLPMYAGLGFAVDAALAIAGTARIRRAAVRYAVGAAALLAVLAAPADIVYRGIFALAHRPRSNYGLDDRRSIAWLLASHFPGDAILTTHYGLVALWWYAGIPVNDRERGSRLADGSPIFEIGYVAPEKDCAATRDRFRATLAGHERAAVYLGFRMNVEPVGFDDLVLRETGRFGALTAYREYAEESRLAIFDLARTASAPDAVPSRDTGTPLKGCIGIKPAARW